MRDRNKTKEQLISELKKLRGEVAEAIELKWFKTICDRAGYGVVIRDLSGRFVYINDSFARMHGYTSNELIGKHYSIMHTQEQVEHVESLEKIRRTKGSYIAEIGHKRRDGTIFPSLMNGTMLKDDRGNHIYNTATAIEITDLKRTEQKLRDRDRELERKNRDLEEANTALRVLLTRRDRDKRELEEKMLYNVKELIEPVLEKLKHILLDTRQQTYISILESNLKDIVSPFARGLMRSLVKLTPSEIHIANLIREGKTTKDIGELMNLSTRTIEFHRKNIRKKLGIRNKKENLRSHLLSLY